jgi:hypothetical protein
MKITFRYKKGFLSIVLISFIVFTASFSMNARVAAVQNADCITMTYMFAAPSFSTITVESTQYNKVFLEDAPCSGDPGEPLLPVKDVYLLLPAESTIDSITITGEKKFIGSGFNLMPCGKPIPLTPQSPNEVPQQNKTVYSSDTLFPGRLFSEIGVYEFRGYNILVLMLYPVQYIPKTGDVFYYPSMQITVNLAHQHQQHSLYRALPQDSNELTSKIQNPSVIESYQHLVPKSLIFDQYDLLILTTDELKNGFVPLAEQHNQTGTRTIIRTLSDVGGTSAEDIREYLRLVYLTMGIRYVLLGGDAESIAAKMLWVEGMDENVTLYETFMPSDLYYACLDGPYNSDGDEKWGEPNDGENGSDVDLIADVYVGRACVDTIEDVNNFVHKTVEYLSLSPNETYLGDATFAGEYLGDYGIASYGGTTLDQLINGSSENGFTTVGIPASIYHIDKLYDELYPGFDPDNPGGTGWPKQEIIDRINNGVHFINHDGHAYYEYNMRMNTGDVNELTNDHNFCFVYSQGCMSGGFDTGDCIAEYFTVKNMHGAFAGIWNARYGFFWSYSTDGDSQRYHRQFWDAVFGENIRELGRANHDSKEDNLFLIQRSCMRWVYYETNLFGDPAVAFLNASGETPQLRISDVTGRFGQLEASIVNEGNFSVSHIPWSLTITGGFFHRIDSFSAGSLEILTAGDTVSIAPEKTLFGLGKVFIEIHVKYTDDWLGTAVLFGPFVLRVSAS